MGVSRSASNSPIPSAPKASFTPSKRPMFNDIADLEGAGDDTKACAQDVVVAAATTA